MAASESFSHKSVMLDEIVELFRRVPAGVLVDATLGGAGHATAILETNPHLSLVGIDRDSAAIAAASQRLARFAARAKVRNGTFDQMAQFAMEEFPDLPVTGVLFDLGVSSHQIDSPDRGFSYRQEGPLDMRMDSAARLSATDIVNGYDEAPLAKVLREGGEEKFAFRIAKAIIAARPISNTTELAEIVRNAIPAPARRRPGDPAKRSFQALRLEVNAELPLLERALDTAVEMLAPGGRCVVLSYHSGEDRLVKARFVTAATGDCVCPPKLPCVCGARIKAKLLMRSSRKPADVEVAGNSRAKSARLRAIESIDNEKEGE